MFFYVNYALKGIATQLEMEFLCLLTDEFVYTEDAFS